MTGTVLILGPSKDFRGRKTYTVYAENRTRGRFHVYKLELDSHPFRGRSALEIGSFIGDPRLKEFENFGSRESAPYRGTINSMYYDEYPRQFLGWRRRWGWGWGWERRW